MDEEKKKNNQQNSNEKKETPSSYTGNSNNYKEPSVVQASLNNATVQTVNKAATTQTTTVTPSTPKIMDARVAHLYQLIRAYKDKVADYRKTQNNELKLWKFFWDIAQYILESNNTTVMDTFFKEYVHDEDLYDQTMSLRFIFECKDVHVKNTVTAFYQVNDSLRRYFAARAEGGKARCFLSIRAVARTFEGHETFVTWVNGKKSK